MAPLFSVLALLSICIQTARASTVEVKSALRPSPVVLSGTLAPAALSVNGHPLSFKAGAVNSLLMNGSPVAVHTDDVGSFQVKSELSEIELKWRLADGTEEAIAVLEYPIIRSLKVSSGEAEIEVDSRTRSLLVDGAEVGLENGLGKVGFAPGSGWLESEHTLELKSKDGGSRLNSLTLDEALRDQALSDWVVGIGALSPPGGGQNAVSVSIMRTWASRLSLGLSPGVSFGSSAFTGGNYYQNSFSLRIRGGYSPFRTRQTDIDFRRLTVGLLLIPFFDHNSSTYLSGPQGGSSHDAFHATLGFFVRFEPVRVGRFGLVLYFEPVPVRAYDYGSVLGGPELCFHW